MNKTENSKAVSSTAKPTWDEIRNEYVTTDISLRKLCDKYSIAVTTMQKRAKKENWADLRERLKAESNRKVIKKFSDSRATNADKANEIIEKLMNKIYISIDVIKDGDVQSLRQLVSAIKDLKEMSVFEINAVSKDIEVTFKTKGGEDLAD